MSVAAHGATLEQAAKLKELDDLVRQNKVEERLARLKAGKAG
jgi:phage shock protein A